MKNRFPGLLVKGGLFLILCICVTGSSVQQTDTLKKWNFLTGVYLMFPNMNEETGVGNPVETDAGSSSKTWFDPILITRVATDINNSGFFISGEMWAALALVRKSTVINF